MPLFGNTFSPKKTPPRKSASLSNLHTNDVVVTVQTQGGGRGREKETQELQNDVVTVQTQGGGRGSEKDTQELQLDRSTREIELGIDCGAPVMNIGGQSLKFEDGQWLADSGGSVPGKELQRLKKRIVQLEEENNLLKLKNEILLDMLTETTAESHLMERELEMKSYRRKK